MLQIRPAIFETGSNKVDWPIKNKSILWSESMDINIPGLGRKLKNVELSSKNGRVFYFF